MSYNIFFFVPFFISLIGMKRMISQKLSGLSVLDMPEPQFLFWKKIVEIKEGIKNKIHQNHPLKNYSFLLFLQKNLKKISIFSLSLYNKICVLNEKLIFLIKKNGFTKKK